MKLLRIEENSEEWKKGKEQQVKTLREAIGHLQKELSTTETLLKQAQQELTDLKEQLIKSQVV